MHGGNQSVDALQRKLLTTGSTIPEKLLLPTPEACKALGGICPRTLWGMTWPRGSIKSVRIGSRVLYSVEELRKWIDAQVGAVERGAGE